MYKHYNTKQQQFVLNYEYGVEKYHIAKIISDFIDTVDEEVFIDNKINEVGRKAYHPRMMIKILLFAYSRKTFSGRNIELMINENLPMMWLAQGEKISYRTINRFRASEKMDKILSELYSKFITTLQEENLIQQNEIFIDGTKLEANANKYSFVWKKATENYNKKLDTKVKTMYLEQIKPYVKKAIFEENQELTVEDIKELSEEIEKTIEKIEDKQEVKTLTKIKKKLDTDFMPRKEKYEMYLEKLRGRNSFSKTDEDATFMRTKEDHMKNGQLKPCYNLQIATENQYTLAYELYQTAGDTRTLLPFLSSLSEKILEPLKNIVADAGYGSEENYTEIIDTFEKVPLIPYGTMEKEKKKKFKNDKTNRINWNYNEKYDYYTDHNGVVFSFKTIAARKNTSGYMRDVRVYEADSWQKTEKLIELSKTPKGSQRRIEVNLTWEYYKEYVKRELLEKQDIYRRRKIEVESVFGHLKANLGMPKFTVRGKKNASNQVGLALFALNMKKYRRDLERRYLTFSVLRQIKKIYYKNKVEISKIEIYSPCFILEASFVPAPFTIKPNQT